MERAAARGKAIGVDNLDKIAKTSLDKLAELEALAAAPPTEQANLIERAAAGEQVTARRGNDVDPCISAELRKAGNATLPDDARAARNKTVAKCKEFKKKADDAKREARSARASRDGLGRQLLDALAQAAKLRDTVDTLERENAIFRAIFDDPDKLRERIDMLAAMKERRTLVAH